MKIQHVNGVPGTRRSTTGTNAAPLFLLNVIPCKLVLAKLASACVGNRFSAPQIGWNRSARCARARRSTGRQSQVTENLDGQRRIFMSMDQPPLLIVFLGCNPPRCYKKVGAISDRWPPSGHLTLFSYETINSIK